MSSAKAYYYPPFPPARDAASGDSPRALAGRVAVIRWEHYPFTSHLPVICPGCDQQPEYRVKPRLTVRECVVAYRAAAKRLRLKNAPDPPKPPGKPVARYHGVWYEPGVMGGAWRGAIMFLGHRFYTAYHLSDTAAAWEREELIRRVRGTEWKTNFEEECGGHEVA